PIPTQKKTRTPPARSKKRPRPRRLRNLLLLLNLLPLLLLNLLPLLLLRPVLQLHRRSPPPNLRPSRA
ncbi:MAG TPA: hypothetical protein VM925_12555, partial [Labilithrix sp.]|nr:hypothetical protein [Labilithrix sp.]